MARRCDVDASQLFNWMRDPPFRLSRGRRREGGAVFLPVENIGAGATAPSGPAEEAAAGTVEIELPNGCRLTLRGGFDPGAVARLARGLGG